MKKTNYRERFKVIYDSLETREFYLDWVCRDTLNGGTVYIVMSDAEIERYGLSQWLRHDVRFEPGEKPLSRALVFHLYKASERRALEAVIADSEDAISAAYAALTEREYREEVRRASFDAHIYLSDFLDALEERRRTFYAG